MSDGQLLGRFNTQRDETAFALLVRRHGPMVLRVCQQTLGDRHLAEDAFQATFLVLARRSDSIQRPELLGNWLYGVALRTSWEARTRVGRRREYEVPAVAQAQCDPVGEAGRPDAMLIGREELQVLHEEVSRLPDRYRIPIVLCELEGLTYQEAARRLRCPVGTIGVRLSRARERLRVHLIRRGILPAAALTGALFGIDGEVAALVSAVLVRSTVRAAARIGAEHAMATGLVSTTVATLTSAVLKSMARSRLRDGARMLLALGVIAGIGWVGIHRPAVRHGQPPLIASDAQALPGPPAQTPPQANPSPVALDTSRPLATAPRPLEGGNPQARLDGERAVDDSAPKAPSVRTSQKRTKPPRSNQKEVAQGEWLFAKEWVANDPQGAGGDGLGPVYNDSSCIACHGLGAPGGAGPESKNVVLVSTLPNGPRGIPKRDLVRLHPGFRDGNSTVLHRFGADPDYASWRRKLYESGNGQQGARSPARKVTDETADAQIQRIAAQTRFAQRLHDRTAPLHPTAEVTLSVSERNTPALFGAGQIDAIPAVVMLDEAKRQPTAIRGRVSRDREGRIGRFGWKAQVASLHEFVRRACASEIGLEVPGHSQAPSPIAPDAKARGLDLTEPDCDALVAYVRALPAPVAVDPSGPHGTKNMREGRLLFAEVGCAGCHAPSLGRVRGIYSDLLLHDMGRSLSDSGMYYGFQDPESPTGPSPNEWRTPPLWGYRDSGPYLHDGRAQTLEEAVALHGGQGSHSAKKFFELIPQQQLQIEAFLKSLVAPSAAASPGLILAAELEAQIIPDSLREAEAIIRKRHEIAEAREQQRQREEKRRKLEAEAVTRAHRQLQIAENLERSGKINGALDFYRQVARAIPETQEGRSAAAKITAIQDRVDTP